MAKWPLVGYDGVTRTNGPDGFHAFGGTFFSDDTEEQCEQELRDTYTASNLRVFISAFVGGAGADDVIMVFRVNGGDGNGTVTVNGTGEFEDTSNTDSLVSGDLICMESEDAAQGHDDSWTTQTFQVTLDASSDVPPIMGAVGWSADNTFASLQGGGNESLTETDVEYTMRATRVLTDLRIFATSWTSGSDTVITMRKDQSDTSLTVTITGTGEFLDTSNSASYVAGDEANYGASNVTDFSQISVRSVEADTSSGVQMWVGTSMGAVVSYMTPSGIVAHGSSFESRVEVEAEDAATVQNLFVNCITNNATRIIRLRKNAADGNASVSVTGTGIFEDTSNIDSLVAEDDVSIQQESGGAGLNTYLVAVEWETAVVSDQTIDFVGLGLAVPTSFGVPTLAPTQDIDLSALGLAVPVAFGVPAPVLHIDLNTLGFNVLVTFGVSKPQLVVPPPGFNAPAAFGVPTVVPTIDYAALGLAVAAAFGIPTLLRVEEFTPPGFNAPFGPGIPGLASALTTIGFNAPVLFGVPSPQLVVLPPGFNAAVVFGIPLLVLTQDIAPAGFNALAGFGVPDLLLHIDLNTLGFNAPFGPGIPVLALTQTIDYTALGLAVPVTFGVPDLVLVIDLTSLGFNAAFGPGIPTLQIAAGPQTIVFDGFGLNVPFGPGIPILAPTQDVTPSGLAVPFGPGIPDLVLAIVLDSLGLSVPFGPGVPNPALAVTPPGLAVPAAFGIPDPVSVVTPPGFSVPASFGVPDPVLAVTPPGLSVPAAFGVSVIVIAVTPGGFNVLFSPGVPSLAPTQDVTPSGFNAAVVFGIPVLEVDVGGQTIDFTGLGLAVAVAFGVPVLIVTSPIPLRGRLLEMTLRGRGDEAIVFFGRGDATIDLFGRRS